MDNNNQTQAPKQQVPAIVVTTQRTEKVTPSNPPDLVNFRITNPLVYIKYWWKRIMAHEGITIKITAKPVTVFGVALIAFSLAFGLGGVVLPFAFPWIKVKSNSVIVQQSPTPTPNEWREASLKGILKKTTTVPVKFLLLTSSDEAVNLTVPQNLNLNSLVGRRILVTGNYNQKQKNLIISDVQDLEILPTTPVPIPTQTPAPTSTPTQNPTSTVEPTVSPTVNPTPESSSTP